MNRHACVTRCWAAHGPPFDPPSTSIYPISLFPRACTIKRRIINSGHLKRSSLPPHYGGPLLHCFRKEWAAHVERKVGEGHNLRPETKSGSGESWQTDGRHLFLGDSRPPGANYKCQEMGKPWQKPPANFSSALPPLRLSFFFLYAPGVNKREGPSGYKNHIIHEAFHAIAGVSVCVCKCVCECCESQTKDSVFPNHPLICLTVAVTIWGGVICLKRPMPKRGVGLSALVQNSWKSQCFCGSSVPRAHYFPPFFSQFTRTDVLKETFSFKCTLSLNTNSTIHCISSCKLPSQDRWVVLTPDELLMLTPALSHIALTWPHFAFSSFF